MFMCAESIAKRDSEEIGSCLLKYCISLAWTSQTRGWLYFFLDSCGGRGVKQDRDFAETEFRIWHPIIYTPEQWRDIVAKCGHNKKFVFTQMSIEDMVDLTDLKKSL